MSDNRNIAPDDTAVRTALWRALHLDVDAPPHLFEGAAGVRRAEPDMSAFTQLVVMVQAFAFR
ncbi:MAG TPA: hypothetical protein VFW60_05915 [Rhodanobacteraceae bacterium]|nr:hypothetical protein [Rhodanobacteraceae bacterium]